jgi:hypothetical protein
MLVDGWHEVMGIPRSALRFAAGWRLVFPVAGRPMDKKSED